MLALNKASVVADIGTSGQLWDTPNIELYVLKTIKKYRTVLKKVKTGSQRTTEMGLGWGSGMLRKEGAVWARWRYLNSLKQNIQNMSELQIIFVEMYE